MLETDGTLKGISADDFLFDGGPSPLAIAFISPHLDFPVVVSELCRLAGKTPVMAASTAGELCSVGTGTPLYKPTGAFWSTVVVQIFSPALLSEVSLQTIPLHNDDIRQGAPTLSQQDRVERIAQSLKTVRLPFRLDSRNCVALTFIDGLSASENYLMEAVYRSAAFPCLFVGGSTGGKFDFRNTYLFDGQRILENHAVIAFLKLAPGKRYGVLKSQNFRKTGRSFVVVDANPDLRTVSTILDETNGVVVPVVEALSKLFETAPEQLMEKLAGHTFAIELDGELFVRSVADLDQEAGELSFFCDINQGDELLLVEATDFAQQTRRDVTAFLRGKPKPLAALLNDCILRRLNNENVLSDLNELWDIPVAGFSTFGELLGININQTLTALVFFDTADGPFEDDFVDSFPIHYASFCSYFERRQLNRIKIMNRLRSSMARRLASHLGASSALAEEFESLLTQSSDVQATLNGIHATLAREIATEKRVRQAEGNLIDAIEAISEGFALFDTDDRLVICNRRYREMFLDAMQKIEPGRTFREIVRLAADIGLYDYHGKELDAFVSASLTAHKTADGSGILHAMVGGRWLVSKDYRTHDGGIVTLRTDVTELKKREEEVRVLKTRYELILRSAGDGIIGVNARERITFANDAAGRMVGVATALLEGRNYREVLCGNEPQVDLPHFPLEGETWNAHESRFQRADGTSFFTEFVLAPIRQKGSFEGAVVVFRDISLRKQYEDGIVNHQKALERQVAERTQKLTAEIDIRMRVQRALAESQGRLMAITASLVVGVLLVDIHGIIVFANKSAHRWLDADSLVERELDEVLSLEVLGNRVGFTESPFHKVIEGGDTIIDDDAVFVTASGKRLCIAYATAPLEEDGRRRIAIISFRDIEALKKAQRDALQASRLATIGQLAAGIAHEINTPVQYVGDNLSYIGQSLSKLNEVFAAAQSIAVAASEYPQMTELAAQYEAAVKNAKMAVLLAEVPLAIAESLEGVTQIGHIVSSMKEFSHPGTANKIMTNINRAIESTATVCRNVWKTVAKVEMNFEPSIPPVLCFASEMNQVFLNLIVNAAHAIETSGKPLPGKITITTRYDGESVIVEVADSGTGIPEELRERIFDPFFTTKEVGKGTGQGLAICRDVVVSKHGGSLEAGGIVGEGAVFTIRLPVGVEPSLPETVDS
ncbi:FIST N-terminal domain-containing protein [Telmatospirillum sp.]|uniref:FIST N-terminal domain-containing protein n=1 Tax=Telmatospirillum sp. TaxID=2079197 RepID=UPI002841A9E1|nr:FIST N-terminal domain-containing protein [Telmatospirillum sp.]MDR3439837.1 PAS domain S-box protein [Telmatospirillum sp.]